jgi:hypothetical protein
LIDTSPEKLVFLPRVGLDPVEPLGVVEPEPVRVLDRAAIHGAVAEIVDQRLVRECLRNRNDVGHLPLRASNAAAPGRALVRLPGGSCHTSAAERSSGDGRFAASARRRRRESLKFSSRWSVYPLD